MSAEAPRQAEADGEKLPPLWAFVPLASAATPPEPTSETVRRGWRGLLKRLFIEKSDSEAEAPAEIGGEPWPEAQRERWLPRIDEQSLVDALDAELGDDRLRHLVVGPTISASARHWRPSATDAAGAS